VSATAAGKPSLLITVTCSATWKQITDELLPGQTATDCPDVCARVFNDTFANILQDVTVNHVLGHVIGCRVTTEQQQRGLPCGLADAHNAHLPAGAVDALAAKYGVPSACFSVICAGVAGYSALMLAGGRRVHDVLTAA
jgi:hypothetical protein